MDTSATLNTSVLTTFITLMLAVSIAAERMVEVLKGWFSGKGIFNPSMNPAVEGRRCAWVHCLAGICGVVVAAVGHVDLFAIFNAGWPHSTSIGKATYWAASWATTGLLASGGSAFWNHALDLLKATKIQNEQSAKFAVANTAANPAASAVQV